MNKVILNFILLFWLLSCTVYENNTKEIHQEVVKESITNEYDVLNHSSIWTDDFYNLIQNVSANDIILDVRTKEEFDQWYIKWAILLDYYQYNFKERLNLLDKNKTYYIYCRSGNRSWKTLELMKELWFTNIIDLDKWIIDWWNNNLPLEKLQKISINDWINSKVFILSELKLEEITHENFWNNLKYFSDANYNFPNIKFFIPNIWNKNVALDTDSFSKHIFTDWENKIIFKDIYIQDCYELFSYCENKYYRNSQDKFNEYKKYNEKKWLIYKEYYFKWLKKIWFTTNDWLSYLFEIDWWILELDFIFNKNLEYKIFMNNILDSIKRDKINK